MYDRRENPTDFAPPDAEPLEIDTCPECCGECVVRVFDGRKFRLRSCPTCEACGVIYVEVTTA